MRGGRYQAYQNYKPSEIPWIEDIPSHWNRSKIGFESSVKARLGWKGLKAEEYVEEGYVFLATPNIKEAEIDFENVNYITSDRYLESPEIMLQQGDVLVTKDGSTTGTTNVVRILPRPTTVNSSIAVIRPKKSINSLYLYYFFTSDYTQNVIKMMQGGMGVPHLFQADLRWFDLILPPIGEQSTIANFLDHETAKIDTLIDKQQQLIKLLKEKRQAVISHAVTKGLNPDAPMKDSGVEWLGEVPEHWKVCKLKHIILSLESGVSVNAADTPAQENEKGILKTSCVYTRSFRAEENKTVFKEEENRLKCPVRKGAIIISRMNTPDLVGASALVENDCPNVYLPDRLWQTFFANNDSQNPKFVAFFMMLQGFRSQISLAAEGASSSMQNIAKEDYLSINIALPEIIEQDAIVRFVERKLEVFRSLEGQAERATKLLQERRTALISAAVTGKIDVRNWKPGQSQIPMEASA